MKKGCVVKMIDVRDGRKQMELAKVLTGLTTPFVRGCYCINYAFTNEEDYRAIDSVIQEQQKTLACRVMSVPDILENISTVTSRKFTRTNTITIDVLGEIQAHVQMNDYEMHIVILGQPVRRIDVEGLNYIDLAIIVNAVFAISGNRILAEERYKKHTKFILNKTTYSDLFTAIAAIDNKRWSRTPSYIFGESIGLPAFVGKTFVGISGIEDSSDAIILFDETGKRYLIHGSAVLVDSVDLISYTGNVDSLLNTPILHADVKTIEGDNQVECIHTLTTSKGSVTMRWILQGFYENNKGVVVGVSVLAL